MKQRLGIAAALIKDPDLLILGQPTNGMDPAGTPEMRTFIRASLLMADVEQTCARVVVISKGRLVGEGTVDELRGRESLWLRAEPLAKAEQIVRGLRGVDEVARVDGGLRVGADPAAAPAIARALVEAGLDLGELRPERASLEKVFLELTEEVAA